MLQAVSFCWTGLTDRGTSAGALKHLLLLGDLLPDQGLNLKLAPISLQVGCLACFDGFGLLTIYSS